MELAAAIRKKTATPEGEAGHVSRPPAARSAQCRLRPAYLQRKLAMSRPGDADEREADRVAHEIAHHAGPRESEEMIAASPSPAAARIRARPAMVKREDVADEEVLAASRLRREPEEEEVQLSRSRLWREAGAADEVAEADAVAPDIEARIEALRGTGRPLPAEVREDMEQRFGQDFSRVGIHTDDEADALCRRLRARAFAVGHDLFFAHGEFVPETPAGRELLAHELTHVVQQGGGAQRVARTQPSTAATETAGPQPPAGVQPREGVPDGVFEFDNAAGRHRYVSIQGSEGCKELHLPSIAVPSFKRRHQSMHTPEKMKRKPGERNTDQRSKWKTYFGTRIDAALTPWLGRAEARGGFSGDGDERIYYFRGARNNQLMVFGTREQLKEVAIIPFWDAAQQTTNFQVDHCLEDQLGGSDDESNYELLEASANGASGSLIARGVNRALSDAIEVYQSPYYRSVIGGGARRISGDVGYAKSHYLIAFGRAVFNVGGVANGDRYWSLDGIAQGNHLAQMAPLNVHEVQRLGRTGHTQLFTSSRGGVPVRPPAAEGQRVPIWPRVFATGPINIAEDANSATIAIDAYRASENPNGLQGAYTDIVFHLAPVPGMDAWAIDRSATLAEIRSGAGGVFQSLRLPGLSPIRIDEIDIDPELGFVGRGKLLPTVPLLSDADIDVVIQGSSIRLQKTFTAGEIALPSPFQLRGCSVTVFAGTDGLGAEGEIQLGIDRLGEGEIRAQIIAGRGFELDGRFAFDERLFGRGTSAECEVGYREGLWRINGTLTIPEGRITGIRQARIEVGYDQASGFSAEGEAGLSIPGVEEGSLSVRQNPESGFEFGGRFTLSDAVPGIRSGSLEVTVREVEEAYSVSATGTARPALPGIDSELTVSYDDGAFLAELRGAYRRGMLAGEVSVGATNRSLDDQGLPTGEAAPGNPIIVYGSGEANLQVAPWLRATAGIRFAPDGEVSVAGEIGIPGALEIFPRREINRRLFNIAVQAPIVPGIVAEIGGGLSAQAGIGAGMLEELRLGVEYNPADEAATRVDGEARLRVPADAGLRLSVRAGIGLGITGASATGGLEIGGALGVQGAASASVIVEWTPASGLALDANLAVHAEPNFTFDISGYVSVRALGFSVYDERWQLASYSFGSGYRFGISLPVAYREDEPFDVRLEDVQFQIPDIDPSALLRGLVRQIV